MLHLHRRSATPQRRLTPIDKRHKNRGVTTTNKRRSRRPEATEVSPQYGDQDGVIATGCSGGGPKYRVTSGGKRASRLRPLLSRRARFELAEMMLMTASTTPAVPPVVKVPPKNSGKTDNRLEVLERGTTFTSSVVMSAEGYDPPSPFQLHHLPLTLFLSIIIGCR